MSRQTVAGHHLPGGLVVSPTRLPAQYSWYRQSPFPPGRNLFSVCFSDPRTGTAVGECGTIVRTTDGGGQWTIQQSGSLPGLHDLSFASSTTGTAVGDSGTILWTTDGGRRWISQTSGTTQHLFGVALSDELTGTAVGDAGTILRTTDGGATWISQQSGMSHALFDVCFTDASTGTAVGHGTILHTTNAGTTWNILLDQFAGGLPMQFDVLESVCFAGDSCGMAVETNVYDGYGFCSVYRTTNGGTTWGGGYVPGLKRLAGVSLVDPSIGTAVGNSGEDLYRIDRPGRALDRPTEWRHHISLAGVCFSSPDTGTIVGERGGPHFARRTAGASWTNQQRGVNDRLYGVSMVDAMTGSVSGEAGKILRTTDGGTTWRGQPSGTTKRLHSISFVDPDRGIVAGEAGTIVVTTDGGALWRTP